MIALHSPLLSNPCFDLVVSGINRGDNCGLHVIYSGTVGAAREAACKDVPALAFSLDDHTARTEVQYLSAAKYAVCIVKATLGILPDSIPRPLLSLKGYVVNINFPGEKYDAGYKGLYLCFQGQHCSFPDFQEVEADPHFSAANGTHEDGHKELHAGKVVMRAFRNAAGFLRTDNRQGSDSWAVATGWVSVTPVGLRSDIPSTRRDAVSREDENLREALAVMMKSVAAELKVKAAGLLKGDEVMVYE
jgi:5'-nucleotidase